MIASRGDLMAREYTVELVLRPRLLLPSAHALRCAQARAPHTMLLLREYFKRAALKERPKESTSSEVR